METRKLVSLMICQLLLVGAKAAGAQQAPTAQTRPHTTDNMELSTPYTPFDALALEALGDHPSVAKRRADLEAERAKKSGVGLRPNPRVSVGLKGIPWSDPGFSSSPMSGVQLGVSQPLWWPGELASMRAEAEARAEALAPLVDAQQVELIIRAVGLYYDIYQTDRTIAALVETKAPLREFKRLLKARLSTGKARVAQVERVRLELLGIDDRLFKLRHRRPEKVARLNAVLNRPAGSPVNPPAEPVDAGLDTQAGQPVGPLAELVDRGMQHRPVVEAIKRRKRAARAAADTAEYERYPDLKVFGSWRFRAAQDNGADDGTDFVGLGVSSSIPIWSDDRADAAEDVAQAQLIGLDASIAEFRLELRGRLQAHLAELHHDMSHARYYRDTLIPQAKQVRKAALAGFQAGQAAYEDWIDAQEKIVELNTKLTKFEAGVRKQRALILATTGQVRFNRGRVNGQEDSNDQ